MPNTKNLAADALEELGQAAYAREKHEMRNNKVTGEDDSSLHDGQLEEAYEHKKLKR
jgi:hypothetical protein